MDTSNLTTEVAGRMLAGEECARLAGESGRDLLMLATARLEAAIAREDLCAADARRAELETARQRYRITTRTYTDTVTEVAGQIARDPHQFLPAWRARRQARRELAEEATGKRLAREGEVKHYDYYHSALLERVRRSERAQRRRRRLLRRAGIGLGCLGILAAVVAIWWPDLARWPLAIALLGTPVLLLAGSR